MPLSAARAHGGHLEVLQWARAHGCDWHKRSCLSAASMQDDVVLYNWIKQQPD
jgi:hypothetical protein